MSLIPFPSEHLRVQKPLPFAVHDVAGQVVLAAGVPIESQAHLQRVADNDLLVDESAFGSWNEQARAAADESPAASVVHDLRAASESAHDLIDGWQSAKIRVASVLREATPGGAWLDRFATTALRVRELAARDADAALYLLIQTATHDAAGYSAHHALLCAVVCDLCASTLQWPAGQAAALVNAALSMNIAMTQEQNALASQIGPLSADQRSCIDAHAAQGAELLRRAGVADRLWLDVVAAHHSDPLPGEPLDRLSPEQRLTRLLRRADIFTAKISRRNGRNALPPTVAAREVCLGPQGRPDEIGAALLKGLGLYPPGTYVRLLNGDIAVVLRRGQRADQPQAASVLHANGEAFAEPEARNTADARHAIKGTLHAKDVRVLMSHQRLLALPRV